MTVALFSMFQLGKRACYIGEIGKDGGTVGDPVRGRLDTRLLG